MAKRKKSVKKSSVKSSAKKSSMKEDSMKKCGSCGCWCGVWKIKISSMAFILFLITVWPTLGNALLSVHWGWYLAIAVICWAFMFRKCNCSCHK